MTPLPDAFAWKRQRPPLSIACNSIALRPVVRFFQVNLFFPKIMNYFMKPSGQASTSFETSTIFIPERRFINLHSTFVTFMCCSVIAMTPSMFEKKSLIYHLIRYRYAIVNNAINFYTRFESLVFFTMITS